MDLRRELRRTLHPAPPRLPDFLIIGVAKGATTTLMHNLGRHPDIFVPPLEINFFDREQNYARGEAWYRSQFKSGSRLAGDKSPGYIYATHVHERMHQLLPEAKLLLILRDPVRRALSNWNMRVAKGKIDLGEGSTADAFDRLLDEYAARHDRAAPVPPPWDIVHRGRYAEQLRSLLRHYPRAQVSISITERLATNPDPVYREIYDFLGVSFRSPDPTMKKRAGRYAPAKISPGTTERLRELYAPGRLATNLRLR